MSQNEGAGIHTGHIHQHTGAQPDAVEGAVVLTQRHLVCTTAINTTVISIVITITTAIVIIIFNC